MELACERLVRDLISDGHNVQWLAHKDGVLPDLPSDPCQPIAGTDIIYNIAGVPAPVPYPSAIGHIVRAVRAADLVVIVEANFLISVMAYAAAGLFRKKVLLIQHVGEPSTLSRLARLAMRFGEALFTRRMVRNADAVVYISRSVAQYFEGVRKQGLTQMINHSIDVDLFDMAQTATPKTADRASLGLPTNGKLACFVGRITESKGILVIQHLARQRPDWTIAIAGTGPINPNDWQLSNVVVLGQLHQAEVAQLYRCSDAMVLPSQSESFSLVVREAMACGCRVVCGEQILETDPRLQDYISTVPIDLEDVERTAGYFAIALDSDNHTDPMRAREYVVNQCSVTKTKTNYTGVIEKILQSGTSN
ncbi:glycosyltransferase family 4 protein [Marinobacter alexandrii]|uniref:glycosyltransferase family 4 protein n=1 Tax=Marinobacter alexandrii TaxID=2570351 RepID=UPI003299B822